MVSDNEGDLSLHFATTYSSPSMLQVLTSLGDCRATLIRNSLGRLAIDNLIESYTDNDEMSTTSMDDDHNDDSSESKEDDSDESGGEDNSSDDSEGSDSEQSESSDFFGNEHLSINALYRGCDMKIPPFMRGFSLRKNWKQELWSPVRVLIEAAAKAIVRGNCIEDDEPPLPPIHSAVIAIKYASFPAIVLFTSILQGSDTNDDYKPKFFGGIVAALNDTSGNTYRVASDEDREHYRNNVKSSSVIGRDDSYLAHVLHTIAIINDGNGASRKEVYEYIKKNQEEEIYWVMIDRAFQQAYDFELVFEIEGQGNSLSELLEEDSYGNLPSHYACGDVSTLLPSAERRTDASQHDTVTGLKTRNLVRFNTDALPHSMIEYLLLCEPSAARRRNRNGRLPLHLLVEDTKSSVSKDNGFNLEVSSDVPKPIQSFHTATFEMTTYQNITEAVYAIIDMYGFSRNERCHFLTFGNKLYQIMEQGGGLWNDIEKVPYYFMWEDTPIEYQEICKKIWYGQSESVPEKLPRHWDDVKLLLYEYPEALVEPDAVSGLYPFQLAAAVSSSASSQDNNQSDLVQLETTYLLIMEDPSLLCQLIENR